MLKCSYHFPKSRIAITDTWLNLWCRPRVYSVPPRLGTGQGAKEIGHNLARERPNFGHNPAREQNKIWAPFCGRSMKTWAQICKRKNKNYVKKKLILFFNSGRALRESGRAQWSSGRAQDSKGRAQHPQKYA